MVSTTLVAPETSVEHLTPAAHPERPERFRAVMDALAASGLMERMERIDSGPAAVETVLLCHGAEYVRIVEREAAAGSRHLSTGDTHLSPRSFAVALEAVGAVTAAVDSVVDGKRKNAFCALRPPGHHARPDQGMGFCIFNNAAVGARHALRRRGLERVLIADWDVHHGNGTQDIFYEDPAALFFSTHQSPWYPGTGKTWETGAGAGKGATINCPFPSGAGREEILGAFRRKLLVASNEFKPDLVMVSAGFDSRLGDPLGEFRLGDEDFAELTAMLLEIADKHAGGRLVSVLEGGYSLSGLANAVTSHVAALADA